MPGRKILVTGAAGFIGSHVAHALLARGASVVALDHFDTFYDPALKRTNIRELERAAAESGSPFRLVERDIRDEEAMRILFERERFDGVIHLAARAGVRPSIAEPALYASVNVFGTTVLLEAARRAGCGRFVCASSSSVYGNNSKVPFAESDPVDHPISPYAATKKACELIGHTFHHLYGMPTAMLRFFTVFGPRQRPDLAISLFMRNISRREPIPVFGDGSMSRDYTYIDDIVAGVIAAYERIPSHGYRVWNLGGNRPVTLRDMIRSVERTLGIKAIIDPRPTPPGDVERTYADLKRSAAELGFNPSTDFEAGLARQWDWMRSAASRAD
ncbi:MAG: GDP-mannose 4,6-dehydratase [Phycisphaerae bacterium]|nr:GDP-mannose 4,6-dehydratase [Phycisphaerae bacterium]